MWGLPERICGLDGIPRRGRCYDFELMRRNYRDGFKPMKIDGVEISVVVDSGNIWMLCRTVK